MLGPNPGHVHHGVLRVETAFVHSVDEFLEAGEGGRRGGHGLSDVRASRISASRERIREPAARAAALLRVVVSCKEGVISRLPPNQVPAGSLPQRRRAESGDAGGGRFPGRVWCWYKPASPPLRSKPGNRGGGS